MSIKTDIAWADGIIKAGKKPPASPKPPPGYTPIPGSKHNGYHKLIGSVWHTWYAKDPHNPAHSGKPVALHPPEEVRSRNPTRGHNQGE